MVRIEMEHGGIIDIELYPDKAPITVANFEKLVKQGFYEVRLKPDGARVCLADEPDSFFFQAGCQGLLDFLQKCRQIHRLHGDGVLFQHQQVQQFEGQPFQPPSFAVDILRRHHSCIFVQITLPQQVCKADDGGHGGL